MNRSTALLLLNVAFNMLILGGFFTATLSSLAPLSLSASCWVGIKYVFFDRDSNIHIEVVGPVWITAEPLNLTDDELNYYAGADWNNRPYKVQAGQTIYVECPKQILGATFVFWQQEESNPNYQGEIVTDRILKLTINDVKTVWWANYVGTLTSLDKP